MTEPPRQARTGPQATALRRPTIVETVTQADLFRDKTQGGELFSNLRKSCDAYLLQLNRERPQNPAGDNVFQFHEDEPALQEEILKLFEQVCPDIVHTHRLAQLFAIGATALRAGVPHVVHTIGSDVIDADDGTLDRLSGLSQTGILTLVVPTKDLAGRLPAGLNHVVIRSGIDCDRYHPGDNSRARRLTGLPPDAQIIGCASPCHALGSLLHATFRLDRSVHLALFGDAAPDPARRKLIRRLGLEERVHVLGDWARPELVYRAIDAYFHGPSAEWVPRAVLAAQASGKPAIACTPVRLDVLCRRIGLLLPTAYAPGLSQSLDRVLREPAIGESRHFILDQWNGKDSADGYFSLFRTLTETDSGDSLTASAS